MSATTVALMGHLGQLRIPFTDTLKAGPAAAQSTAIPVNTMASRFTSSPGATGSVLLRDIATNECPNMHWVINDSGFTMNVYPFGSQTINGGATPLTVANGGFAFLARIRETGDWRGAVFT